MKFRGYTDTDDWHWRTLWAMAKDRRYWCCGMQKKWAWGFSYTWYDGPIWQMLVGPFWVSITVHAWSDEEVKAEAIRTKGGR